MLGVGGSIAAYKIADLASKLTQAGAQIETILTAAAQQFITPLTFQALTGRPVYTDLWAGATGQSSLPTHIAHVGLGESADLLVIAPATADRLAKLAHGLAGDLLSVVYLAARCPVMIAPAMDGAMYDHPTTRANLETLHGFGMTIIEPEIGRFASGLEGRGRLPETSVLLGHIRRVLGKDGPLKGRHVVVTVGGTREAIDPVRYITNHSSGKQGYAIAQAALDAGARVTLISTPLSLPMPIGAEQVAVDSATQMEEAVFEHLDADALIMAAAVADYRPKTVAEQKIKKNEADLTLELAKNNDILVKVGEVRRSGGGPKVVIGFAAETQNLHDNARAKLEKKNLDLLVANDVTAPGAGFGTDTNLVTLFGPDSEPETLPLSSKAEIAEKIMMKLSKFLSSAS